MKAKVDPRKAGIEVLSIGRTRKEEVLLVLKKGGDVSAFGKELDHVSGGGSCPVFQEGLRRLRGRNWSSCNSTSEGGGMPRTSWCRLPGRGGPMYCLLVSSTNGLKTLLGFGVHQVGPASLFVAPIWASPNDPFVVFETQILLLEESLSEDFGRSLIGGDFNSESPEWGKARLDRRGILVGKMVARNDLIVLNRGKELTFRRGAGGVNNWPHDCRTSPQGYVTGRF